MNDSTVLPTSIYLLPPLCVQNMVNILSTILDDLLGTVVTPVDLLVAFALRLALQPSK